MSEETQGASALDRLSDKQRKFVDEYLVDLNATQAAIRAGYKEKAAYRQGADNLRKPQIVHALNERRQQLQESGVTVERVLEELARIAFVDTAELFDDFGNLKDIRELPKEVRAVIASLDVEMPRVKDGEEPVVIKKVRLWDKHKALDSLAKRLGFYERDNEQKNPGGALADLMRELADRRLSRPE